MDLDRRMADFEIWQYALDNELVIVSKDTDFSDRIGLSTPPPRVIHICIGNMRLGSLYSCLLHQWPTVIDMIVDFKLIRVFSDRIEAVAD